MTDQQQSALTLFGKIAAITAAVQFVEKRGKNTFHKYDYATKDDIFAALKPALTEHQVAIMPSVTDVQFTGEGKDKTALVQLEVLIAADDQQITRVWWGQGQDTGDKAFAKAYANAIKTFLINLFQVPCGDDDEPADDTPRQQAQRNGNGNGATYQKPTEKPAPVATDKERAGLLQRLKSLRVQAEEAGRTVPELTQKEVASMPLDDIRAHIKTHEAQLAAPKPANQDAAPAEQAA